MPKRVSFAEKDSELVRKIEEFQKTQKIPSFIETIRILCKNGLQVSELVKNVK